MSPNVIRVVGARVHNLKNITVEIPHDKLVIITGLSGSGKSSLAFDTIFAEGQRRYVESLSAYARQFLGQMNKPDVDYIDGLVSRRIRLTKKARLTIRARLVGTVTEIYDYLRLLYRARRDSTLSHLRTRSGETIRAGNCGCHRIASRCKPNSNSRAGRARTQRNLSSGLRGNSQIGLCARPRGWNGLFARR